MTHNQVSSLLHEDFPAQAFMPDAFILPVGGVALGRVCNQLATLYNSSKLQFLLSDYV